MVTLRTDPETLSVLQAAKAGGTLRELEGDSGQPSNDPPSPGIDYKPCTGTQLRVDPRLASHAASLQAQPAGLRQLTLSYTHSPWLHSV